VYLNNSNLKFPIGLRLQGIIETNPFRVFGFRGKLVSIGSKKSSFIKKKNGFKAREIKKELNSMTLFRSSKAGVKEAIADNAQYLMDSESFIKQNNYAKDKEIQFPVPGICCRNGMQY
jgi:Cu(I)/Ag(I) efflux system membrane fusion protein